MPFYPITFSIPPCKITNKENCIKKRNFIASLIPGDNSTYIYITEKEYYESYQSSYYAITLKKCGWDCLRHYEILANNCIPYFIDIENCPKNTMGLFPKELIIESNKLFEKIIGKYENIEEIFQKCKDIELTPSYEEEYNKILDKLVLYTKEYLTTVSISNYILKSSNNENISKILFLNGCTRGDYLRCLTLAGFKTNFKTNCHEYPIVPHLYKDKDISATTAGLGFSYTHILEPHVRVDDLTDEVVINNIKINYYDIVIYGSYHRGKPFFDIVLQSYPPDKIIMLCGEDIHCCDYETYSNKGIHVFIREL